jgi:CRISPR system Cascade subunit CasE
MRWLAKIVMSMEDAFKQGVSDSYSWHQKLWECFPNVPEKKRDFLTRLDSLEGFFHLWLLAQTKPVCPLWCPPDSFCLKEIAPSFLSHRYYAFDLRANPVKTIAQRAVNGETLFRANGKRRHGKRIPIVKQDELKAWIIKKGNIRCRDGNTGDDVPGGFRIVDEKPLEIRPMTENYFRKIEKSNGTIHRAYHGGVQFRGTLEVTDQFQFSETYYNGIGSAKGFGLGLLLLAPVKL